MSFQELLQQMIGVTLVMLLLVGCGTPPPTSTPTPMSGDPVATPTPVLPTPTPVLSIINLALLPGESVIIGKFDGREQEFNTRGYVGIHEFECVAGLNCDPSSLPAALYSDSTRERWDPLGDGVERLTIRFVIDDSVNNTLLRISRAGSETL